MKQAVATVSTKGQIVIPAEIREALGIVPGTRVTFSLRGNDVLLQPATERLIDELMGSMAGGPSMADELQAMRRADDKDW